MTEKDDEAPLPIDFNKKYLERQAIAPRAAKRKSWDNSGIEVVSPGTVNAHGIPDPPTLRARR